MRRRAVLTSLAAAALAKLLAMQTAAIGLAVPGMPVGSPGMEMGSRTEPYDVLLVAKDCRERVFSSYR